MALIISTIRQNLQTLQNKHANVVLLKGADQILNQLGLGAECCSAAAVLRKDTWMKKILTFTS